MKWLIRLLVVGLVVAGLYKLEYPTYTYRYRMTVEVDAAGETRSASSVIEVNHRSQPHILPEMLPFDSWARGQAVFVQLPGDKNIIALLASGERAEHGGFPVAIIERAFKAPIKRISSLNGRRELTPDQMPTLVTATNPNDAATVRVIRPDAIDSALGAHLRSISVELTTEPVTAIDIDSKLPFLVNEGKKRVELIYPNVFTPSYSIFIKR